MHEKYYRFAASSEIAIIQKENERLKSRMSQAAVQKQDCGIT
jgi:hypothetical protein